MNDFKKKRVRKGPAPSQMQAQKSDDIMPLQPEEEAEPTSSTSQKKWLNFAKKHFIWTTIALVIVVGMGKMAWRVITLAENVSIKEIVLSAFSEKIKSDDQHHTNILLLGTGNDGHHGENLTDTMMVASLDHETKSVSMFSIPRDLYITIDEMEGGYRINSIFELYAEHEMYWNDVEETQAYAMSYDVLAKNVGEILGIPIHYYTRVDFQAFIDIVNAIDGIDIEVKEPIYDPYYPAENGTADYTVFSIGAGIQHMDGKTALKYVRSRKTTSDFNRATRQQQVLQAIKEKALTLGILKKPNRLKDLYDAITTNFDTNLQWNEMVYLAKISEKFDQTNVKTWVLNDNPLTTGGFLYTPDRELYNGAYVLLPYLNTYEDIQRFVNVALMKPEVHQQGLTYQVLNGTYANGVATEALYYLQRFGFEVVRYGNAAEKVVEKTQIIPRSLLMAGQDAETILANPTLQHLMTEFIPIGELLTELPQNYSPTAWETDTDIIIVLGNDYVEWMRANKKRFY